MDTISRILVQSSDRRGITAAVTAFIASREGNLLDLEQHTDPDHGEFLLRACWNRRSPPNPRRGPGEVARPTECDGDASPPIARVGSWCFPGGSSTASSTCSTDLPSAISRASRSR